MSHPEDVVEKLRRYVVETRKPDVGVAEVINAVDILYGDDARHTAYERDTDDISYAERISRYNRTLTSELQFLRNEVRKAQRNIKREKHLKEENERRQDKNHWKQHEKPDTADEDINVIGKTPLPSYINKLTCLPHILVTDRLESTVHTSKSALEIVRERETALREAIDKELALQSELNSLSSLLETEVEKVKNRSTQEPLDIINNVKGRHMAIDNVNRELLIQLKGVLDSSVADILYSRQIDHDNHNDSSTVAADLESLRTDLVETIESLLNEMFEPSETSYGGYVKISDPDGVISRFLLQGDLITVKKNDSSLIRLRDFGKPG